MSDGRFEDYRASEETSEVVLPLIGRLYRHNDVVLTINGTALTNLAPNEILRMHRRGHWPGGYDVPIAQTAEALPALLALDLAAVELDLGRLLLDFTASGQTSVASYVTQRCADLPRLVGRTERVARDVVLYGFGRIGRLLARLLVAHSGDTFRLRAIVVREQGPEDLERRANLLRRDSVHGAFKGTIRTLPEENALLINGTKVQMIFSGGPEQVDYTKYGIRDALVIDNTGKWRDREGLGKHLLAVGVDKVILTAPGKGDIPNIVSGINDSAVTPGERILSAASCTTNAIVPVLKVLNDRFGIVSGHIETVHAYTNDQNLIDNYHKKTRRGRGAAMNMVITETGAASAVAKAVPALKGKLTANAIRVPTPNVSMAILNLRLEKATNKDELNAFLLDVATTSHLRAQVGWTAMTDTVSTDMVGETHAGVIDAEATIVQGDNIVLYVWYDNEFGYSCQVVRMLQHTAGVARPYFP